ncbi:MAG: hypothetical protein WC209_00830 [Ignavibacteriaceae bacterium]|jgi:hypothetical protein
MKKYFIIIPFIFALISCEKTEIVESEINTQTYIVVNSELNPYKLFAGVTFTKTLPVGVPYDIKAAELKDVKAYIKINGVQVIPLHFTYDGIYKPKYDELIIEKGSTYELFAEWGETVIYSSTKVPSPPEIISVSYDAGGNYLQANIKTHPDEVYGAIWVIGSGSAKDATFPNLSIPEASALNTNVITSPVPVQYRGSEYNGKRNIQVYAFDMQYTAYFNSAKVNVPVGNAFTQNGGTINWNVFGNNVIGMFIGVAKGNQKNVN